MPTGDTINDNAPQSRVFYHFCCCHKQLKEEEEEKKTYTQFQLSEVKSFLWIFHACVFIIQMKYRFFVCDVRVFRLLLFFVDMLVCVCVVCTRRVWLYSVYTSRSTVILERDTTIFFFFILGFRLSRKAAYDCCRCVVRTDTIIWKCTQE